MTTGTYNSVSFLNATFAGLLTAGYASLVVFFDITQFSDQVEIRFIWQCYIILKCYPKVA